MDVFDDKGGGYGLQVRGRSSGSNREIDVVQSVEKFERGVVLGPGQPVVPAPGAVPSFDSSLHLLSDEARWVSLSITSGGDPC